jgi:DNA-binding protein H-NS
MPPRDADLSKLSIQGLLALRDRIELEIDARREADENRFRMRGGMIERDGPRYRNPENSAETWSGKGEPPAWVDRIRAQGVRLEDLEIVDDRPAKGAEHKRPNSR